MNSQSGAVAVKMSFRWYGESDPVSLQYIRQIPGVTHIVSAVYAEPAGEVSPAHKIDAPKATNRLAGPHFEVVEMGPLPVFVNIGKARPARLGPNCPQTNREPG